MAGLTLAAQQGQQRFGVQLGADVATGQQAVGQVALGVVQGDDLFLDGVLGYQAVDGDRPLLAHAVGTVAGLVFHCRVPPRVEVDHVVGRGQVEAGTAGFQADQENVAFALLERVHPCLALARRRGAVQVRTRQPPQTLRALPRASRMRSQNSLHLY